MKTQPNYSESILQKRVRRFKSIKRGYYSFIILLSLYLLSIIAPLLINSQALIVKYANEKYDNGETFTDLNQNDKWDVNEPFQDLYKYYSPAFRDLIELFITPLHHEGKDFGQYTSFGSPHLGEPDYRLLKKQFEFENEGNYVIMPIYPYDPLEDMLSSLSELFDDINGNGIKDDNENFYDSNDNGKFDTFNPPTKPGGNHIFGTDNRGRDVFSRLIYGFQISITFGLIVTFFAYSLGILIGGTMGYFGGKVDLFGVRIIEIFMAIPFLFLMMIIASLMRPNVVVLALILVFLTGWIGISFFIRGEFYREKAKDYVSAAISMGQSNIKIMFKHILPNALTPIITYAPFAIIGYIGTLVILDFLGFGLQPPTPSWGELISQARENLSAWHLIVTPLSAMAITLFLITFIGEAVREAFDPKTYSRLR